MIGVLLVSHSKLADGMKAAVEFIAGTQENFYSLGFEEAGVVSYRENLEKLVEKVSQSVSQLIIICDIPAGSPGTNAYDIFAQTEVEVELLSGMNLAMLLELLLMREGKEFHRLIADGIKAGKESVDRMDFSDDNEEEAF